MPTLEDGQLFERYRVHRWLGSGIAGESYEAEDRILQRKVTLKLIHPWATLPDSARRQFFREMQGISLLNHPYLATVLDYGETEGRIYVARRYVSSGSLLGINGRLWFHAPLPLADAFTYAHQLAQALQYIHQHGYLHGSFTFANVLVLRGPNSVHDTDYAPFLMADIGLATFVRRFGQPRIETLPVSAAPEQLGKRVTPASDQFALAVLLYFWLAGRPPYLGTSSEVEYQKLSETITPLSILNPSVTLEQDNIILRALTVYPEDRYPSVLAFTEELIASLSSANRLYTPSLTPQAEMPPTTNPRVVQDNVPENPVEVEAQGEPMRHAQATTDDAEEVSTSTPPSQSQAERYGSALEELLALPPNNTGNVSSNEETNKPPIEENEESIKRNQQKHFTLFPTLPETPPVGAIPAQTEFAFIPSEEAFEQQTSKQTGPLAAEPDVYSLYSQADEPAVEMPLDIPDSTDFTSMDELSPVREDTSATVGADDSSSIDEEEMPTVPREEFANASKESELLATSNDPAFLNETSLSAVSPDQPAPPDETTSSTALHDQPLPSSEEARPMLSTNDLPVVSEGHTPSFSFDEPALPAEASISSALHDQPLPNDEGTIPPGAQEGFAASEEGLITFPLDDLSSFSELISPVILPDEPLLSNEENTPTVPLKEPTPSANEDITPLSSDKPAHFDEVSTPPTPQAEIFQAEEDARSLAEQANGLREDVHVLAEQTEVLEKDTRALTEQVDILEEDTRALAEQASILEENAHSLAEQANGQSASQSTSEEAAPTVPLKDLASAPPERATPLSSNEPALPTPLPLQVELAPREEDPRILSELDTPPLAATSSSIPASMLEMEVALQPQTGSPIQEVHETSGTTYPPIDEAIIAPHLIISSPYTSNSYEFLLIDEETTIGRAGTSNLYLEQDNLTSRHHALLKRVGERALIFDKRSHNGIFLNGQKIEAGRGYELADGDHIGIGNYELIFRSAPSGHVSQLI